jgi:hypothetical protein
MEKCGYGNFNHRYNVSPILLDADLGVGILQHGPRVCQLPMKWSTIA